MQGRILDFKLGGGGAHLKKMRRTEGGANFFLFLGISCEKSRFYTKKSYFFPILGGGARAGCAPPGSAPEMYSRLKKNENIASLKE